MWRAACYSCVVALARSLKLANLSRVSGFVMLLSGGLMVLGSGDASAQEVPSACFVSPAKLPDSEISGFIGNPNGLLVDNPDGGLPMSSRVRSLAGSSADAVRALIALVPSASIEQRAAIGSGLARAARACARPSPLYAAFIQEQVASLDAAEVIAAFLAASEEVQTAAVAGAGGAGGGGAPAAGLGGGGLAGPFSGGLSGDDAVAQTADALSFSTARTLFSTGDTIVIVSPVQ